jgi:hypothetical protein
MAYNLRSVKKYFSKFVDANFLFSNAFVPLAVLTLYFLLFSYFLPQGVNSVFSGKVWKISLLFTAASGILVLSLLKIKGSKLTLKKPIVKLSSSDLILLLLPLTPVVQYIINNQDILSFWQSFYVFGIFVVFSAFFVLAVPKFLGFVNSTRTLSLLGTTFAFTVINMASLSRQFSWFEVGSLRIQMEIFGGLFLASWFLYDLNFKKLLYFLIGVYFVSNTAVQAFIPHENKAGKAPLPTNENNLVKLVGDRKPISTPNIYLLVYDGYVPNETMLAHGIDNSSQEEYLKELGFQLYPRTYSVGGASINTMSRVLNASTEYYGNIRRGVSGDGIVQNLLGDFGYKTYGLFPSSYFFRGADYSYDFSFPNKPDPTANVFLKAILMGEFRFDVEFNEQLREQFITTKQGIFENDLEDPRFIYMHTNVPGHAQNSGACLPNEIELIKGKLVGANLEMRQDLETIIRNDPQAIVIVAGDHGPHLTKNCTLTGSDYDISEISRFDIQDRFGTFLAIKWPAKNYTKYDDITVLQDLFPSVFSFLFKDGKLLEAKVDPSTLEKDRISGASVKDGIIYGGINDGESLFITDK